MTRLDANASAEVKDIAQLFDWKTSSAPHAKSRIIEGVIDTRLVLTAYLISMRRHQGQSRAASIASSKGLINKMSILGNRTPAADATALNHLSGAIAELSAISLLSAAKLSPSLLAHAWRPEIQDLLTDDIADQFYGGRRNRSLGRDITKTVGEFAIASACHAVALQCPGASASGRGFQAEKSPLFNDELLRKFDTANLGGDFSDAIKSISPMSVTLTPATSQEKSFSYKAPFVSQEGKRPENGTVGGKEFYAK